MTYYFLLDFTFLCLDFTDVISVHLDMNWLPTVIFTFRFYNEETRLCRKYINIFNMHFVSRYIIYVSDHIHAVDVIQQSKTFEQCRVTA